MSDDFNEQRRQFITGAMLRPNEAGAEESDLRMPLDRSASHFERYSKNAMACEFELLLNLHQYQNAAEQALVAFAILDSIEDQMSIYRESSELSQLNRSATQQEEVNLDQRLSTVLNLAQQINLSTKGAFDITAAPLSRIWGFQQRSGRVPNEHEISDALATVGMQNLCLNADESTLRFLADGMTIDLGGIGKGYAIDLAAESLLAGGIHDFVLQGGQSSVAASGVNIESDSNQDSSGWKIGLSHPSIPNCRLAEFDLVNQKLGTSGTQRQGFFYKGRRFGHIIDPRTGYPTDHCLSSTVVCDRAAAADALATAFFVMQLEDVQLYCDQNPEIAVVLVYPEKGTGVRLETFNCDALNWRKLI